MKNYPHLYPTPLSKKVAALNRTPHKQRGHPNTTITTKTSHKTLLPYTPMGKQKNSHHRTLTRSIDEMHLHSDMEGEDAPSCHHRQQQSDEELFSQSYSKIGQIQLTTPHKNIDVELNQVLNLIKEEKMAINIKMRALKQSNEQYKSICEGYNRNKTDCAINTDDILESAREMVFVDQSVGHEIKIEEDHEIGEDQGHEIKIEHQIKIGEEQGHEVKIGEEQGHEIKIEDSPQTETDNSSKCEEGGKVEASQTYLKMSEMLLEMNINPKHILPCQSELPSQFLEKDNGQSREYNGQSRQYNGLSDRQVIQIQKFFIKKLIEKLNN